MKVHAKLGRTLFSNLLAASAMAAGAAEPAPVLILPPQVQAFSSGVATSRVIGSPDPPSPYRVEKALPELPIEHLITFRFEPGTERIVYVDQLKGAKNTRLMRYDLKTRQLETLLEPDELIYGIE